MESTRAIEALTALAQPTRLEAFRTLVRAGPAGLAAGELAERLGVPPPTLSFHLAQLARVGMVLASREGRSIRYAAGFGAMRALVGWLLEDCCRGQAGTAGPAAVTVACCTEERPRRPGDGPPRPEERT